LKNNRKETACKTLGDIEERKENGYAKIRDMEAARKDKVEKCRRGMEEEEQEANLNMRPDVLEK
jgi:hypothetical protein